jgi:hypothetical protein
MVRGDLSMVNGEWSIVNEAANIVYSGQPGATRLVTEAKGGRGTPDYEQFSEACHPSPDRTVEE